MMCTITRQTVAPTLSELLFALSTLLTSLWTVRPKALNPGAPAWDLQAEEAEGKQEWGSAERLYAEATFIDTAASLINTALWLGLCRTRWHLQLSEASVEACDQTLAMQPDNVEAVKYKVSDVMRGVA